MSSGFLLKLVFRDEETEVLIMCFVLYGRLFWMIKSF